MAKQETSSTRRGGLRRKDAPASDRGTGRLSAARGSTRAGGEPVAETREAAAPEKREIGATRATRSGSGTRPASSRASRSDAQPSRRTREGTAADRSASRTPARSRSEAPARPSAPAAPSAPASSSGPGLSRAAKTVIEPLPPTPVAHPAFERRLPAPVDVHVTDLLASLARLYDVIVAENTALARMDFPTARSLLDEKERATQDYRRNLLAVHRNPGLLLNLADDRRAVMRQAGEALKEVSEENCRRLQAGMDAIGYTIESVFQAVREYVVDHTASYTEEGTVEPNFSSSSDKSISVNRTL